MERLILKNSLNFSFLILQLSLLVSLHVPRSETASYKRLTLSSQLALPGLSECYTEKCGVNYRYF